MKIILSRSNRGEELDDITAKLKHTDEIDCFIFEWHLYRILFIIQYSRTVSASGLNMFLGTNRFGVQAVLIVGS